jgi:transposase InsO family protein
MSIGGHVYFVKFIGVYFLKEKIDVFEVFKRFKAYTENESARKIITIRLERGGEYTPAAFQSFCREHGIRYQLTAAYTLQ